MSRIVDVVIIFSLFTNGFLYRDLSFNTITMFPSDVFGNLSKLRDLALNNNEITMLPSDVFGNLSNLQYL